jgi:hypothetical protein
MIEIAAPDPLLAEDEKARPPIRQCVEIAAAFLAALRSAIPIKPCRRTFTALQTGKYFAEFPDTCLVLVERTIDEIEQRLIAKCRDAC